MGVEQATTVSDDAYLESRAGNALHSQKVPN